MNKPLLAFVLVVGLVFTCFSGKALIVNPQLVNNLLDETIINQFDSKIELKLFKTTLSEYVESNEKIVLSNEQWKSFEALIKNLKVELKSADSKQQEVINAKLTEINNKYISIATFLNQYLENIK